MMDDILKQIKAGEVSGVQFKERILDKYDIACELVAFSNSHGGKLVVGIKDKKRMDSLYLLQFACLIFMLVNAFILAVSHLHVRWESRRYERSR